MRKTIKFVQIIAAPWGEMNSMTSSIYALGDDGMVYRFVKGENEWQPLPMNFGAGR